MSIKEITLAYALIALFSFPIDVSAESRDKPSVQTERFAALKSMPNSTPYYESCVHDYNNLLLTVTNMGFFGSELGAWRDCETGQPAPSAEFPAGTGIEHLNIAALWIGAIVGDDTLVSVGYDGWQLVYEMWPCGEDECGLQRRSKRRSDKYFHPDARSDLEYVTVYTDTFTIYDPYDLRIHIPLDLEITQTSYSWSIPHAQDFVIFDYQIRNIGSAPLQEVYAGIMMDGDVGDTEFREFYLDDLSGFKGSVRSKAGHSHEDTIDFAWTADNDGDPAVSGFNEASARSIAGCRLLRLPDQQASFSFNWWASSGNPIFDWGPMRDPGRTYGTGGLGTPEGDRNKYYLMSNREIDYDQAFCWIDFSDDGWLPPSAACEQIARGADVRCLLSAGPWDLAPEETKPLTIAYVAGEGFHQDPMNFEFHMMYGLYEPDIFYHGLNFEDIGENAVMAGRVFDNPGVDTDGDGYAGRFWVLMDTVGGEEITDTFYYAGDDVPDFRAAVELPVPKLRFAATNNCVTLRWNGLNCEKFADPVTRVTDFEGYKVYMGRAPDIDKLGLLASQDLFNFVRLYWDDVSGRFKVLGQPLTLKTLRSMYGEKFDPEDYRCNEEGIGFEFCGAIYCFIPVGWNQSIVGWDDGSPVSKGTELRKRYANEIETGEVTAEIDSLNPDLWLQESDPATGDTILYHKYYEYEYTITGLPASMPYYFAVTAFDFGDVSNDFASMETSPMDNVTEIWPINYADDVLSKGLKVRTYPNPYFGEDSRETSGASDGDGDIVFADLPPRCTIRIFTVSGDLVRKFSHPGEYSDTDSQLRWDLSNKRDKKVKSGIFIYSVESDWGNQIGKIVIIL
jgi:hypothetical protein